MSQNWLKAIEERVTKAEAGREEFGVCLLPDPNGGEPMSVQLDQSTCRNLGGKYLGGDCIAEAVEDKNLAIDNSRFILNCLPSPKKENDWSISAAVVAGVHSLTAIPSSKDLREPWWTIGNQGSTGSCVGWGTADGVLRWHFVKANRLNTNEPLSMRYVWMAAKETDMDTSRPASFIEKDGTWLKAALDIVRNFGVVTNDVLPFQNAPGVPELYTGDAITFYSLAAQRRIASYFNLGKDLADWRAWIANNGPILTRLDVDTTWDNATWTQGNLDVYDSGHTRGGHCVALVGYTEDRFIVRNSWSTSWGDGGFGYASDGYAFAAFTEAYGVTL